MRFTDRNDEHVYTIQALKRDYTEFKGEDPYNHSDTFTAEFFEILMATINGRNDLEILGMTSAEINRFTLKLRKKVIA